jgi:iron complex outermembrane receptor protein
MLTWVTPGVDLGSEVVERIIRLIGDEIMSNRRFSVRALTVATAITSAASAFAQQSESSAAMLEEVVVTAQRKEENLQRVPLSVTALSAETLARNDIRDLSRVELLTPGFSFGRSGSDARPAIRGVRTENVSVSGDPSIGFFVDNVYRSRASQANEPFVDVARVEVQRGPQGTLYGRNTFGGNIAITTASPEQNFKAGVDVTYGQFDRRAASGFVNLPVSDVLQVRLAGFSEKMDGYVKGVDKARDIYDRDTSYWRASVRFAPNDRLDATLRYSVWTEGGTGAAAFGYRVGGAFVNPATGALDIKGTPIVLNIGTTTLDGIPDVAGRDIGRPINPNPHFYPGDTKLEQDLKQTSTALNISYDFGSMVARAIFGRIDFEVFRNADNDFTTALQNVDGQDDKLTSDSYELQLGSKDDTSLGWLVGAYKFKEDIKFSVFSSCPSIARNTAGCAFAAGFPVTTSEAAFGQISYWLSPDALRVTAGVRSTKDEKVISRFSATTDAQQRINSLTPTGQVIVREFSETTWRLNGEYYLDEQRMLYGSVSTGFRSGGFNGGSLTNPLLPAFFAPETVTAYEIGSKNTFADGRVRLNVAVYKNEFKDLQVQNQFIITTPTGLTTTSVILNAAKAHSQGIELELQAVPMTNLNISLSGALMETNFDSYNNTPAPARYSGFYNLTGNEIPYSPRVKITGSASYDVSLGAAGRITPQVSVMYSGSYQLTDFNTALDKQDAFTKLDLRLGWHSADDKYSAELFANNVTDEITLNRATFGSRGLNQSFDAPRMWGVRVGARF